MRLARASSISLAGALLALVQSQVWHVDAAQGMQTDLDLRCVPLAVAEVPRDVELALFARCPARSHRRVSDALRDVMWL